MSPAALACPRCLRALPAPPAATPPGGGDLPCPRCGVALVLSAFPRLTAAAASEAADGSGHLAREGDAVCRFYPELQAETVCEECGCLMSRKAAIEWAGRTLCLPCLHALREKKSAAAYSSKRTLHDNVAIGLVVFLWPLTLVTGPIALYQLLRHRQAPRGLVPRGPFRWWLALALSLAATGGWIFLIVLWIAMIANAATR